MKDKILGCFFEKYGKIPTKALTALVDKSVYKDVKKGKLLLKEGQVCNKIYFVAEGCLRLYYISKDIDITVWFSFENNSAIELSSFLSGAPTNYYLEAIAPSKVIVLPKFELTKLYYEHPVLERIFRIFWEDAILILLKRFTALQKDSAKKRYLDLIDHQPHLLQRVSQKHLASYIGITPTSLSRIRRNLI